MTDTARLQSSILEVLIEAIEAASGFLDNPACFAALAAPRDLTFDEIGLTLPARHQVIQTLRQRLQIPLVTDDLGPGSTLQQLAERIAPLVSPATRRALGCFG